MKPRILILIGILITALACNKDDNMVSSIDGQYTGTFERNGIIANVELKLDKGNFFGESNKSNFPAIYFGNFSVNGNALDFDNKRLVITTEFDPSLILKGTWNYEIENRTLTMTNPIGDIYILTRE